MLNHDTCLGLLDAGFPQPVDANGNAKGIYYGSFVEGPACFCPNSDEIIAAIAARWPPDENDLALCLEEVDYSTDPKQELYGWMAHATGSLRDGPTAYAPTLPEALAALYIALAAQGITND